MSDKVADLMLKNRQELFNERDAARRIDAVKSIYAEEAEFFEGNERINSYQRRTRCRDEGADEVPAKL